MALPANQVHGTLQRVRKGNAVRNFKPNDGGQKQLFASKKHELIFAGGNSSGKSYCLIMWCAWRILPEIDKNGKLTGKTIHPHLDLRIPTIGIEGWLSTHSQDVQRDTLEPLIEKILRPYMVNTEREDGVIKRMYFKGMQKHSWINCKWQTQGPRAYAGPKKAFVAMDEPHMRMIYREARARLLRSGGYMMTALTPVVDQESPLRAQDVLWMRDEIVEPFSRHPERFPLRDVIYVDVEENYDYVDGNFIDEMLAGMTTQERAIRKSGLFILFAGLNCFDKQKVHDILKYLETNPDESTPEYGEIIFDQEQSDERWVFEFVPDNRIEFEDKPQGEWALKIWERVVGSEGLQHSPKYLITVDVAEGKVGGDYTAAYVFRKDNRRIVAAIHGHITEENLAKQLWLLGHYYNDGAPDFEPAELAIEVRGGAGYGATTQRYLIHGSAELGIPKYPYFKFYHRPTAADLAMGKEYAFAPGWDTNSKTRNFVVTAMRQAIVLAYRAIQTGNQCIIPDIGALKEACEFILNFRKNRFEGTPDDRLFALGIGHCVLGDESFQYLLPPPPAKELEIPKDVTWYLREDEETGIQTVNFNEAAIMAKLMEDNSGELRF